MSGGLETAQVLAPELPTPLVPTSSRIVAALGAEINLFFKLMEERCRRRPTTITTNLDYVEWANFLGNKSLVEALRINPG